MLWMLHLGLQDGQQTAVQSDFETAWIVGAEL